MNKQRLGMVIAAAVGMLGTFLPWASIPFFGSVSGTRGMGWVTLVLFLVALLMALLGDKLSLLTGAKFYVAIAVSVLAAVIAVLQIMDLKSAMSGSGSFGSAVSIGFGLYVIILAGLAVPVLGFTLKK